MGAVKNREDLRNKTIAELEVLYKNLSERYRVLRFNKALGGLSDLSLLRFQRKELARICTKLQELNS